MSHGVRQYARAHRHAFPLVATRPPTAPWINPQLRLVRRVEDLLANLAGEGFIDEQMLFTYRVFNSLLLGVVGDSAMALRDPQPGDGSFATGAAR